MVIAVRLYLKALKIADPLCFACVGSDPIDVATVMFVISNFKCEHKRE